MVAVTEAGQTASSGWKGGRWGHFPLLTCRLCPLRGSIAALYTAFREDMLFCLVSQDIKVVTCMGVTRLQTPSTLREATVEHLRNDIVTGKLQPGELLKEVELAAQLGLSPTPVREALVQLAGQGLVEIEPNRLKRVAPLNLPAMRELVAVQRVLWQTGYSWGLPNVGTAEIDAMEGALTTEARALEQGDVRTAFLSSTDFHSIVVAASGNRELGRLIADRFGLIERLAVLRMTCLLSEEMLEQDRAVLTALKRGDLAQALCCGEDIRAKFADTLAGLPDEL